jgi:hypothetical protein
LTNKKNAPKAATKASTKPRKEPNRGLNPTLATIKTYHESQLNKGVMYSELDATGTVLQFGFMDHKFVLFMTTVDDGKELRLQGKLTKPKKLKRGDKAQPFQVPEYNVPMWLNRQVSNAPHNNH